MAYRSYDQGAYGGGGGGGGSSSRGYDDRRYDDRRADDRGGRERDYAPSSFSTRGGPPSFGGGGPPSFGGFGGGGARGAGDRMGNLGAGLKTLTWDLSTLPKFEKDFYIAS